MAAATGPSKVNVAFKVVPAKIIALIVTVSLDPSVQNALSNNKMKSDKIGCFGT